MTPQPMTRQLRSRLAGLKLPQHTLAAMLGVSQTKLNLIRNGPPEAAGGIRGRGWGGARPAGAGRAGRGEGAGARPRRCRMSGQERRGGATDGTGALPEVLFVDDVGGAAALLALNHQAPAAGAGLPSGAAARESTSGTRGARRQCSNGLRWGGSGAAVRGAREVDRMNPAVEGNFGVVGQAGRGRVARRGSGGRRSRVRLSEVGAALEAIAACTASESLKSCLRFIILTAVRSGEAGGAT